MDFGAGSDAAFKHLVSIQPIRITHILDCGDGAVSVAKELRKAAVVALLAWAGVTLFTNVLKFRKSISKTLPGWTLSGSEYIPEILSDRVILTPPAPGNKRGGIISSHEINSAEWKASLDFRASGQERGSGNLNIWLAKPTQDPLSSVYTVEKFDGLVLVVDQYGGSGGAIRGFLNDNTVNFRAHHNLDEMAFGHCTYAYRNLGRMSNLILEQRSDGFESELRQLEQRQSERQDELRRNWGSGGSSAGAAIPYEQLNKMESKILSIEQTVQRVQRDIEGRDYKKTLDDLQRALRDTQTNLMSSLPQSMSQSTSSFLTYLIRVLTRCSCVHVKSVHVAVCLCRCCVPSHAGWLICGVQAEKGERSQEVPVEHGAVVFEAIVAVQSKYSHMRRSGIDAMSK
ncbi:hypothetical protein FH972_023187 [Carpinus fangiana]|uniref:L-type lectin-like domain-containing protein n=1 Tax=Carpinus fangiana TaxID=176857 RepID=A0A5N6KUT6_9ROSI|nr:hypothetical protein FH972_023187 [Carpinus fangiana]